MQITVQASFTSVIEFSSIASDFMDFQEEYFKEIVFFCCLYSGAKSIVVSFTKVKCLDTILYDRKTSLETSS